MKYRISAEVTVSAYTIVEADSEEEALRIAEGRYAQLSGYGHEDTECFLIEEADGEPKITNAEELE